MAQNPLNPRILTVPFANTSPLVDTIADNGASIPGQPTYDKGWGNETMIPPGAGGTPPRGQSFNGVLKDITANTLFQQRNLGYFFDQTVADAGGYKKGDIIRSDDTNETSYFLSLVDDNTIDPNTNPDSIGTYWKFAIIGAGGNGVTFITQANWDALPDSKYTDGIVYGIYENKLSQNFMIKFIQNGLPYLFPNMDDFWILKRLSANLDVYVNVNTGDDDLAIITGGTSTNPFKTIMAALLFVSETYFLGTYNITIHVASGTYPEQITFPEYVTTSGEIFIIGSATNSVIIQSPSSSSTRSQTLGHFVSNRYTINSLNILPPIGEVNSICITCYGILYMSNCIISITSGNGLYGIVCGTGGEVFMSPNQGIGSGSTNEIWANAANSYPIWIRGGSVSNRLPLSIQSTGNLTLSTIVYTSGSGMFTLANSINNGRSFNSVQATVYANNLGLFLTDPGATINGALTGPRYKAILNGVINTNGGGPNFFPGNSTGILSNGGQYL